MYKENMNYVHVHVCTISTAATDDLSRDEPGSTVSGTSSATKSTRLTSNTKPKATGALVKSSKAKKGIYNFKSCLTQTSKTLAGV